MKFSSGKMRESFVVAAPADALIRALHAKKIKIFDLKTHKDKVKLTLSAEDCKKFFAICDNMCYNIVRRNYKGRYAPLAKAAEKVGIVIGAAAFVAAVVMTDGVVTGFDLAGDAPVVGKAIERILSDSGVTVGSAVGGETLRAVAREIAATCDGVGYANAYMRGHTVVVEAYLESAKAEPLNVGKDKIISPCDGVVTGVTVMSGTARVRAGDRVKTGDVLIDGAYTRGDKTGNTYALGEASIACEFVYTYTGTGEGQALLSRAAAAAAVELGEREIISLKTELTETGVKVVATYSVNVS